MIIQKIQEGKKVALVTDAGTPGVSDPGNKLVAEAAKNDIRIIPIPGPSALTAIISVAGIDMQNFIFKGFPPHKKGRETFFKEVAGQKYPVIYYESPYRLAKNLELLSKLSPNKFAVIGREITKFYEEITRDRIENLAKSVSQNKAQIKGELVVIVYPHTRILIA
jgi:16S rRNA (cytidine1402-2'-O)-methyltransferase